MEKLTFDDVRGCPFCAGEATHETCDGGHAVGCEDCGFTLMGGRVGIGWYATEDAAVKAWNTRIADVALKAANDAYHDANKKADAATHLAYAECAEICRAVGSRGAENTAEHCADEIEDLLTK